MSLPWFWTAVEQGGPSATWEWHDCEKCGLSGERRIEMVVGRGPGFKCEDCRWWNWSASNTESGSE